MSEELRGKVVVVTGGSAGLGRAIVEAFAREGCKVGVLARGRERLEAAVEAVLVRGGEAVGVATDMAQAAQVEAAAAEVEARFGPIDIWVNNAMTAVFAEVRDTTADEYHRVTEVTYLGAVYGTMAALGRMLGRDRGKIIQIGSALSERSIPLQAAYCGAKHGVRGFTDSLRCELLHAGSGVEVTMVQMPALNTPQFGWVRSRLPRKAQPVPPIYQPEVGARAVVWAATHRKRELYVGFPTVKAMWGNKVAAGLLDRYLAKKAYGAQQTDQPRGEREDNLFGPVGGAEIGSHGDFDARSRRRSVELWLVTHGRVAAGAAVLLAGGVVALVLALAL